METCLVFCHFSTEVNCVMIREGFSGASGGPVTGLRQVRGPGLPGWGAPRPWSEQSCNSHHTRPSSWCPARRLCVSGAQTMAQSFRDGVLTFLRGNPRPKVPTQVIRIPHKDRSLRRVRVLLQCGTHVFKACGASSQMCDGLVAQMSKVRSSGVSQSGAVITALLPSHDRAACSAPSRRGETSSFQEGWWQAVKSDCRWASRAERNHLTQRRCLRHQGGRVPEANTELGLPPPCGQSGASGDAPGLPALWVVDRDSWGCLPARLWTGDSGPRT